MDIKGKQPLPRSTPPPMKKMVPQMKIKSSIYGENGHSKGEKHVPTLIFFSVRRSRSHLPLPPGSPLGQLIIKLTIFSEIIHHVIISKYTLECTQVHYFIKKFSREHSLKSSSNEIKQRYTHHPTTKSGFITIPPHTISKLSPMFEHRFLPLIIHSGTPPPPPPPPIIIGYVTIMPC